MKIKSDFVTNSSSTCYVVSFRNENHLLDFEQYMHELDRDPDASNEGVRFYEIFRNLKELQEYVNDGPLDWARKPMGPRFINMGADSYKIFKEVVDKGEIVGELAVDYNVCEKFECSKFKDIIIEALY